MCAADRVTVDGAIEVGASMDDNGQAQERSRDEGLMAVVASHVEAPAVKLALANQGGYVRQAAVLGGKGRGGVHGEGGGAGANGEEQEPVGVVLQHTRSPAAVLKRSCSCVLSGTMSEAAQGMLDHARPGLSKYWQKTWTARGTNSPRSSQE